MSFKIIAVKPLRDCSKIHLRNLQPETLYYLSQDYSINLEQISYKRHYPRNFFSNKINIEISAIVGKNGSGKSSLTNLIIKSINNIFFLFKKQIQGRDFHYTDIVPDLYAEIYYHLKTKEVDAIYKIIISDKDYNIEVYERKNDDYLKVSDLKFDILNFGELFFYTEVIDYSHYSFNSKNGDDWIKHLFHKNDGYQTPIVLNPYRDKGNIDINTENKLIYQRFLSNIIRKKSEKKITDSLSVNKMILTLKPDRDLTRVIIEDVIFDFTNINPNKIFSEFVDFFKIKVSNDIGGDRLMKIKNYLVYKLASVTIKYKEYQKFCIKTIKPNNTGVISSLDFMDERDRYFVTIQKLIPLFSQIDVDESHITFKIRQIINFLKYNHINLLEDNSIDFKKPYKPLMGVLYTIEFLPPPIYDVRIELKSELNNDKIDFTTLSSGEKQMIFSQNSLFYHIYNLDSVNKNVDTKKIMYENINVVLDEIELYFHPEYQRKYLKQLIDGIEVLELKRIKNINIIVSTHSPFILSDIPSSNVLRLQYGSPHVFNEIDKTFGANIYDLLKDSFFLEGFIGEFSLKKIKDLLSFLECDKLKTMHWNDTNSLETIEIIAEPIIKQKLKNLYYKKFKSDFEIEKEIKELENILKQRKL